MDGTTPLSGCKFHFYDSSGQKPVSPLVSQHQTLLKDMRRPKFFTISEMAINRIKKEWTANNYGPVTRE